MKKRLRKKKHCGEFAEWGCQLVITRNTQDGFDDFLDAFILEAIEPNECFCGGGGCGDELDVVVELSCCKNNLDCKMQRITAWLDSRPDVKEYKMGEAFDLWHGTFKDLEE